MLNFEEVALRYNALVQEFKIINVSKIKFEMKKTVLIIVSTIYIALNAFSTAYAEPRSYLCSAEESTGYDYTNGRWLRERFRSDARYMVKENDSAWTVYEYDIEFEHVTCEAIVEQVLNCRVSGDFVMNMNTMKFSVTNTDSYIHSTRKNRDSVVLTLGSCVAM